MAHVGHGDGAVAVVEILCVVDSHCRVNGGEEVWDAYWIRYNFLAHLVRLTIGTTVLQATASEYTREGDFLITASAAAVEFRRASEFRRDRDQSFVQHPFLSIRSTGRPRRQFLNQRSLAVALPKF